MNVSNDQLGDFYLSLKAGLTVKSFLYLDSETMKFIHSNGMTKDYRLARGRVKKLCDEVTPVARLVRKEAELDDRITFTMDNEYPDCTICDKDGHKREIEVTIAQARERYFLASELNEKGIGRGFIGITDDSATQNFDDAMQRDRRAYSTDEVIDCSQHAVKLCARNKSRHRADTLLIEAPLIILPPSRWRAFSEQFADQVNELAFNEVYLTGYSDSGDLVLKIK